MKTVLTNTTAADIYVPLPDGGRVPANGFATFDEVDELILERALSTIDPLVDAGDLTLSIRPDGDVSDFGGRVYAESLTITSDDLSEAALEETVESEFTFPERARLHGYYMRLDEVFSGGIVSAATVDVGFSAGSSDVLDDGKNVFTGASTGESFGAGASATPTQRHAIGGGKLRAKIVTVDANVNQLDQGSATFVALYTLH